jgi:outer membrane protein TolC
MKRLVSYIEVVDASRDALRAGRGKAPLAGGRLMADVPLIKDLGGGWNTSTAANLAVASVKH